MIVSTSSQFLSVKLATVGFFMAGRRERIFVRFFFSTFIFNPTFSWARIAPSRRRISVSIFCFFHGS